MTRRKAWRPCPHLWGRALGKLGLRTCLLCGIAWNGQKDGAP